MDQANTGKTSAPATQALAPLVAHVKGRIANRRSITTKTGRQSITVVRLPAPDEYTSPQTVELRSVRSLGEVGDDLTCQVRIGGFGRSYKATDPETGEQRVVPTADNTLTVIE
jgi:hypothetical protein